LDLLTSLAQASQAKVTAALGLEALELRQEDTADVLLAGADTKLCGADRLLDLVADSSASNGVADLGEGEGSNLHDSAHLALCIVDTAGDFSEAFGQGLTLALEQVVAGLSTLQFTLHQPQRLPGREYGLSLENGGSAGMQIQDAPETYSCSRHVVDRLDCEKKEGAWQFIRGGMLSAMAAGRMTFAVGRGKCLPRRARVWADGHLKVQKMKARPSD